MVLIVDLGAFSNHSIAKAIAIHGHLGADLAVVVQDRPTALLEVKLLNHTGLVHQNGARADTTGEIRTSCRR